MSSFEGNKVPIEKLYNSILNWVTKDELFEFFEKTFGEYDKKWQKDLRGNHWRNSLPRQLLQVHERIKLTDALQGVLSEQSSVEKRFNYPSLITYLRLTCFDQLGQPIEWMTFDNWLNSKKKKVERNDIVARIEEVDKVKFSEQLYLEYQKLYSVKNSFYRFIREVIPSETRTNLLSKIQIRIYNDFAESLSEKYNGREPNDKDKESYLYRIRNDYTHNTFGKGPIFGFEPKNRDENQRTRDSVYVEKENHSISTSHDFEEYLKEVVLIGIVEIVKR
jgi:hypothetical protein